jgi:putative flippase GtrA
MTRTSSFSIARHLPPGQVARYLVVGLWNTAFGYGTYALCVFLLEGRVPAAYLVASLLASLLNITVSFLGYKWFVFRTRGNYLKEWLRCLMVYSGSIGLGLVLLAPAVYLVEHVTGDARSAPYIAGAVVLGVQIVASFFGHQRFSFGAGDRDEVAKNGSRT